MLPRTRKVLIAFLLATVPLAMVVQVVLRPPDDTFEAAPDGWITTNSTNDLPGLLGLLSTSTLAMQLNTTDYARVAAYASEGYWRTAYSLQRPGEASNAFLEVAAGLLQAPGVIEKFPQWDRERTGAADEVLVLADGDGYVHGQPEPTRIDSPLELGVDPSSYSWRVSAGFGNELERGWGALKPLSGSTCDVPAPAIRTYAELEAAATVTAVLADGFSKREDASRFRSLVDAWTGSTTAHPSRVWLQVASDAAVDAGLDRRASDTLLRDVAIAIHDTQIAAWEAKYRYALASPWAIARSFQPLLVPHNPSYPSEYSAVAAAATTVVDRHAPGVRIRLEMPGTLISAPTTRVYRNTADARLEAETIPHIVGLNYAFSVDAGRDLGFCIAKKVMG
jgi:hypothetical protein